MDLTLQFIITFITISKSACNYAGCSPEATCDVEFVVGAVYGCGGVWSVPGIENGEYLCGDGYSICDDYIYASSLGLTEELCLNSTLLQPNYFYASLQSSSGNLICDDIGFDDVFGCASYESDPDLVYFSDTIQCGPFGAQVGTSKVTAWQYGWYTGQDSTKELQSTIHTTSENANVIMGGVLCCKEMQSYSTTNTYTTYQPEYIRSVSCDDVLSGNIRNGEIDSYNFEFESYQHYESVYVISDCETDVNIKFIVYQIFDNNQNILAHSEQFTYWVQCGSGTQYLDFMIFDINTAYAIDIYTEYNSHNNATYDIYLSCGNPPDETISADCYIGCGESVSGYYENGRPHFCEITSFTKGFGGNIFSGCFSNYDGHELRIYPDDIRSDRTWDDEKCMDDFQRLNWFVWNDTQTYYLQIDGYYSGNYTVSMECGVPTNLSGTIHCPYDRMTGNLNHDQVAWYEMHFDSNLPATFDGCLSDNGIRIKLYDSLLSDSTYLLQHMDGRCIGDVEYYELYPYNNDTYYVKITNDNDLATGPPRSINSTSEYFKYFCNENDSTTTYNVLVHNSEMHDCGPNGGGDSLIYYCCNGIARYCLSEEPECFWKNNQCPTEYDGYTCHIPTNTHCSGDLLAWMDTTPYYSYYCNHQTFQFYSPTETNAYNISYFCETKRRKSTNFGTINCGDFVSGIIDIGDAHLYAFNSTMNDRIYIIGDCRTYDIKVDYFDGYNWQTSWSEYNWQCLEYTSYLSHMLNYGEMMEIEVFADYDINNPQLNYSYAFNVYCGDKPKITETETNGLIDCSHQILTGFIDKDQTIFYEIINQSLVATDYFFGYINSDSSLELSPLDRFGRGHSFGYHAFETCDKTYLSVHNPAFSYLAISSGGSPGNYSFSTQCNQSKIYIGPVTCGDIISGNITNGEIHSYNLIQSSYNDLYIRSSCRTNTQIDISLNTNYDSWYSCKSYYWFQCNHDTAALEEWIDSYNNYTIDVFTSLSDGSIDMDYSYDIHISCGDEPEQQITSADCYIGCGESVSGYYEYGRPHFCEITSFTKGFGGNVFSGCGSNYDGQELRIYPDDIRSEYIWAWDDETCMDDFQRLNWFVWNETQTYYLQIDGHESGNYTVSMECGVPTNLSGEIHCPHATMTGSLKNNETAWYKMYFDSNLPATFDGCSSDDGIRIHLYDAELFDRTYRLQNRDRCISDSDYYELDPYYNNDTFYIKIRNDNSNPIDAAYNVSYFCGTKRRKSTDYGQINCGDFVSGTIDIGDAHLYIFNSTMNDRIYIVSDCDTTDDEIDIDFSFGYDWQTSWNDYNWQCRFDTPFISQWMNERDLIEFEVFRKYNTMSEAIYYGFNVYCGDKPHEPMVYGGDINCGDQNIFGRNDIFFNFSNPQTQTVTFSVCSITFDTVLNLNESNGDVIRSESTNEWGHYDFENPNTNCPRLTVQLLSAGNYTFESKREMVYANGIFLLDVTCGIEYEAPNPQTLQSNVVDDSCNYFIRDDSIMPMDVCFGSWYSYDDKDSGWSKKYTCVNGEAVALAYNTSNCDSIPMHDDDTNTSSAEYNCNATESCPYVLMTHYPLAYDTNINDYICSPNMSAWHKGPEVIDFCRITGYTSSIVEFKDGNLTETHYVGYDCGLTAPDQNEYIYHKNVLRDHHCCGEGDENNCETMSEAGSYIIIDYHSSVINPTQQPNSTSPTQEATSSVSVTAPDSFTTTILTTSQKSTTNSVINSDVTTTTSVTASDTLTTAILTTSQKSTINSVINSDATTTTSVTASDTLTTSQKSTTNAVINSNDTTTTSSHNVTSNTDKLTTTLTNSNKTITTVVTVPTASQKPASNSETLTTESGNSTILVTKSEVNPSNNENSDSSDDTNKCINIGGDTDKFLKILVVIQILMVTNLNV